MRERISYKRHKMCTNKVYSRHEALTEALSFTCVVRMVNDIQDDEHPNGIATHTAIDHHVFFSAASGRNRADRIGTRQA